MAHCIITIEITDYQPKNFNFENFGFTFTSEAKDLEEEINVSLLFFYKKSFII